MKKIIALSSALILAAGFSLTALAAANPSGTGQPNQSCGSDTASMMPNGFSTSGFAHAETVYAGSDGSHSAQNANSSHAVAQYDVACFQVTSNQH